MFLMFKYSGLMGPFAGGKPNILWLNLNELCFYIDTFGVESWQPAAGGAEGRSEGRWRSSMGLLRRKGCCLSIPLTAGSSTSPLQPLQTWCPACPLPGGRAQRHNVLKGDRSIPANPRVAEGGSMGGVALASFTDLPPQVVGPPLRALEKPPSSCLPGSSGGPHSPPGGGLPEPPPLLVQPGGGASAAGAGGPLSAKKQDLSQCGEVRGPRVLDHH